jgi:ABC-type nitrate/sulfonate/bicarbonate transport system permease component
MTSSLTHDAKLESIRRKARKRRNLSIRIASIALLLAGWEITGLYTPKIFLAPFHASIVACVSMLLDGSLISATMNSLSILLGGLALSVVIGTALGLLMGRYRRFEWAASPYVNGLYATPTVALLPLVSLWFGLYSAPKIAIVVLLAVFPIIKNIHAGIATLSQEMLEPAVSMGASEVQISHKIIGPAVVPFMMAGLRLAVGRAIVGLVVGEFFTAQTGLGGMLARYASSFKTAEMFVPIALLAAIGYGLTSLVIYLQRWLTPWKESERDLAV